MGDAPSRWISFKTNPDENPNKFNFLSLSFFTPLEIMPPLLPPGQRPSGPAAATGLDVTIIPAGFNAPLGFESQRLEFLTGFTLSDYSSFFFRNRRRNRLARNLHHRTKSRWTGFKARSAFNAFLLINDVNLVLGTDNRLHRASLSASHTGLAFFRVDIVRDDFAE